MNAKQIKARLKDIRNKAYERKGSYEESYTYIMTRLDKLIELL